MSIGGATYSRTGGDTVLPGTWAYVKNMLDVADIEKIRPDQYYEYYAATIEEKQEFNRLASMALTEPPEFLRFGLVKNTRHIDRYPGEEDESRGFPGNGFLFSGSIEDVAKKLGITVERVADELAKFSGGATVITIPVGTVLYRTVGLTVQHTACGLVTNRLLGDYWSIMCPNEYRDIEHWRGTNAVLAEWNGDFGYIKVVTKREISCLMGVVGMQKIDRNGNKILPGGAQQLFIPGLREEDLETIIAGVPIKELIQPSLFGGHR